MIPLGDVNPTRRTPYLTYTLIGMNILVFLWQLTLDERALRSMFMEESVVPLLLTQNGYFAWESILDVVRSMFFHGGWLHLVINMLYLGIFGDNIEDRFGRPLFIVTYFLSGFAAVFAQVITHPESPVPLVGASGAIAGTLGSYLVFYPRARIICLVIIGFIFFLPIPAYIVLGFWFVSQLFSGYLALGVDTMSGGVAFFAHIGGFMAGMVFAGLHRQVFVPPDDPRHIPLVLDPRRTAEIRRSYLPTSASEFQRERLRQIVLANGRVPITIRTAQGAASGVIMGLTSTTVTLMDSQRRLITVPLDAILEID